MRTAHWIGFLVFNWQWIRNHAVCISSNRFAHCAPKCYTANNNKLKIKYRERQKKTYCQVDKKYIKRVVLFCFPFQIKNKWTQKTYANNHKNNKTIRTISFSSFKIYMELSVCVCLYRDCVGVFEIGIQWWMDYISRTEHLFVNLYVDSWCLNFGSFG